MSAGRRTIGARATLSGIGLHLGLPCTLEFVPAPAGFGIAFKRVDLPGSPVTPAVVAHAIESERRTQLGSGDGALHTVEHVLAAAMGLGIDDLLIEMNAAEPPILDGSARPFLEALRSSGIVEHGGEVSWLVVTQKIRVISGESLYLVEPANAPNACS